MRIEGTASFPAEPERVYAIFTDADALRRATPGCQSLDAVGEGVFEATLKVGVASITGTYKGKMELQEQQPPHHYKLAVQGSGSPGYLSGTASFDFMPKEDGTEVKYVWDVQVGGLVASVGQRVLSGVAKMLINQFFQSMQKELA